MLFVDEAYRLVKQGAQQDFGVEAIEEMIKEVMLALERGSHNSTFAALQIREAIDKAERLPSYSKNAAKAKFPIPRGGRSSRTPERTAHSQQSQTEEKLYNDKEIHDTLSYELFKAYVDYPSEMDFLVALPKFKTLLNIEVKCQTKIALGAAGGANASSSNDANCNLNRNLGSASQQLKKHAYYMARVHGDILDAQWRFVKVAAIWPGELNQENICDNCRPFIFTSKITNKDQMIQWLMQSKILQRLTQEEEKVANLEREKHMFEK